MSGSGSILMSNIFKNNQQGGGYYGAAIGGNSASPIIEGNVFVNNACDNQFLSGVVSFINSSSPQIFNNIFKDNPCRAINFTLPSGNTPKAFNNTIVSNTVGIRVDARIDTGTQIYRNNIIFGNGIGLEVDFGSEQNYPTWENNLVFGNGIDYDGIPNQTGINGNISASPQFADPIKEIYELAAGSPAIDAGSEASCPISDFRNLLRPQGKGCDIGAFETVLGAQKEVEGIPIPGEVLTYTITVSNLLTSTLTDVVITDVVPGSLNFIPGSFIANYGVGGEENGVIHWSGSILTDTALTMGFSAVIDPATSFMTTITNTVEIEWQGAAFLRNAVMAIEPYRAYLPGIQRACPPLFQDDFSDESSGWPEVDDGNNLLEYRNGEYRILVRPALGGAAARNPNFQASDYSVEVDLRNLNAVKGSYGIAFGIATDWSSFYSLEIYDDGWFGIYRWDPGNVIILVENFSPSINQGDATNNIKIERVGSIINAYANNTMLASLTDSNYQGNRYIGLIALSYAQPNLDIRFDNFTVFQIGCGDVGSVPGDGDGGEVPSDPLYIVFNYSDRYRQEPER